MAGVAPPLADAVWDRVEALLEPDEPGDPDRIAVPDRAALNGVLYVLDHDIAWTALPPELGYGSGMACWRRFDAWRAGGVWPAIARTVVVAGAAR